MVLPADTWRTLLAEELSMVGVKNAPDTADRVLRKVAQRYQRQTQDAETESS